MEYGKNATKFCEQISPAFMILLIFNKHPVRYMIDTLNYHVNIKKDYILLW